LPRLTKNYFLNFFGGEPLLSFNLIEKITAFQEVENIKFNKNANYSITTNGRLLTEKIIQFLNAHRFSVVLSFDGLAQDAQKKKGSFRRSVSIIKELLNCSNIELEVNSVFTPMTVDLISESMKFIIALDVPKIHLALSTIEPWDSSSLKKFKKEMIKLKEILLSHYKRKGDIPVTNFREGQRKGIFYCAGGKDRLAIAPEGGIWGCHLFPDYFKGKENSPEYQKFNFGTLDNFIKNYKNIYRQISSSYAQLSMDNFYTSKMRCFLCSELENCAICPINASFSGVPLGNIPSYACEIQKIKIREKESFRKEIQNIFRKIEKRKGIKTP